MKSDSPLKVGLISLGCAKNLVDSEVMLGALLRDGLELTQQANDADILLVNTCGFIEGAKKESIDAILKAIQHRDTGKCKAVIVAGCLAQRYPKDLQKEIPEVDAFIGLNEVPRIGEIVREIVERASRPLSSDSHGRDAHATKLYWSGPAKFVPDFTAPRYRLTPKHFAYVKIAEGCNHPCTFCSIPRIRGKHRSRQPDDVLAEVKSLVAGGTREINLISQDTTFYGKDLGVVAAVPGGTGGASGTDATTISSLLRSIQQVPGDFWVRLLYTHPAHWTDELIATIADCDKVCRYVDIPLQHISDEMLKTMRRETSGQYIRDLLARIRAGIPGVAIRTAFIVGHPGETDKDFNELLDFIKAARFERLGVFAYSQEDHTAAGNAEWQIPARMRQQRRNKAMAVQQRVSREVLQSFVGKKLRVLVEKPDAGRSHIDAPEIDGKVLLRGSAPVGEFVEVAITGSAEYDLVGECV